MLGSSIYLGKYQWDLGSRLIFFRHLERKCTSDIHCSSWLRKSDNSARRCMHSTNTIKLISCFYIYKPRFEILTSFFIWNDWLLSRESLYKPSFSQKSSILHSTPKWHVVTVWRAASTSKATIMRIRTTSQKTNDDSLQRHIKIIRCAVPFQTVHARPLRVLWS